MKKLYLLMLAILILGCGTEKPAIEEPEPVIEEPPPVIQEPPPAVIEEEPSHHPLIAEGTVKHGQVNVDPELLRRDGLYFEFREAVSVYWVALLGGDDRNLSWESLYPRSHHFQILVLSKHQPFKYDTEYTLIISGQDSDCISTDIVITFRTKPQRPVVGRPEPVVQERIPVEALGERFRFEPDEPLLVAGDVDWKEQNVDPEPLNANGIHFQFHKAIRKYKIDLRLDGGATLGWLPRGLVENDMGERIHIMPAEGAPLLEFDTAYEIEIFVEDHACWTSELTIVFRTKPKP